VPRRYQLGKRAPEVARTGRRILDAARELLASGDRLSLHAIARRAGVSRVTVYNRFGSQAGLRGALRGRLAPPSAPPTLEPLQEAAQLIERSCRRWAADPALWRRLAAEEPDPDFRGLAARLAERDLLRPGASLREAEDVLALATGFAAFDRLHRDGRRPLPAVAAILRRLAETVLSKPLPAPA